MNLSEIIVYTIVSVAFIIYGLSIRQSQGTTVGIGGGRSGGLPLFKVEIKGVILKLFGAIMILSGLLIGLAFPLSIFNLNLSSDTISWFPAIGIAMSVIGGFLCVVIQISISLGEKIKASKIDSNEHNQRNVP